MSAFPQDTAHSTTTPAQPVAPPCKAPSTEAEAPFLQADVLEDYLFQLSPEVFDALLKDHTTSTKEEQHNIFWATSDYEHLGEGYEYSSPILPALITGKRGHVIMPRILKSKAAQTARARNMAEVFTPSWVCNAQNNLIDEAWFGRADVFNREYVDEAGVHRWHTTPHPITFPEGKTWRDYVCDTRMEITCGEAPYIVSRYDTTTGALIPIEQRIGLLDRKLRIVSENTTKSGEWLKWAQVAYRNTYAYEWQGDNLLIARESMLVSYIEYYYHKFGKQPGEKSLKSIAYIVSWNVWQMDGLKGVVPDSCGEKPKPDAQGAMFFEPLSVPCEGCRTGDIRSHNGTYCLIRDWRKKRDLQKIRFIDLIKQHV